MNADMATTKFNNDVRHFNNIADIYGLYQLINEPTSITDKSSTIIVLIYTNSPEKVVCSGVALVSISDHSLVYAYRKLSFDLLKGHTSMTYRSFKHFKRSVFCNDISNQNWDFLSTSKDPK